MKKYLIRIESDRSAESVYINGDSLRPFQIAGNLWNYTTPWTAAQRLERLAKVWESNGFSVRRVYGGIEDMPTTGNEFNVSMIKRGWEANMKTFYEVVDEHGNTIAIRKTEKGINNWKAKHKVERCGFHYTMNGKPIYIDFVQR